MNEYVAAVYDEAICRLVLGVEPIDAGRRARVSGGLTVAFEQFPRPVSAWKSIRPPLTLNDFLPRMARHRTGRFARIYDRATQVPLDLRLITSERRLVPRRFRVQLVAEPEVVTAERDESIADVPVDRRVLRPWLYPGANYGAPTGVTALRGRVRRAGAAVRWARAVAVAPRDSTVVYGRAHGDDRGEFVMLFNAPVDAIAVLGDPLPVAIVVGAIDPPPAPDPLDPTLATVDPYWDLPREDVTPLDAASGPVARAEVWPAGFTRAAPVTIDIPVGRTSRADFDFP